MYILRFDGASKGNSKNSVKCGSGAVLLLNDVIINETFIRLTNVTNNQAEYIGLMVGLEMCIRNNVKNLRIEGDSLLVVNQINNVWKIKEPTLIVLHAKVKEFLSFVDKWEIYHIPREKNKYADMLSNKGCQ
jgi:ribonuclease HI